MKHSRMHLTTTFSHRLHRDRSIIVHI